MKKNFQERLEDLNNLDREDENDESRKQVAKKVQKLLKEAKEKLQSGNVLYRVDPANSKILLIVPRRGSVPFNRLSAGLDKRIRVLASDANGLLIEYNPMGLFKLNAGALFDSESFRYSISNEEILSLRINEFTVHELRHAYNFIKALRDGVDHVFLGTVRNPDTGTPFSETYPHEFSIDELSAFVLQIAIQVKNLSRAQKKNDQAFIDENKEFNKQLIQTLQALTAPTKAFSHLFLEALDLLKRSPADWSFKKNFEEGSKSAISSVEWNRAEDLSKIEMSVSPMIASRPEIGKYFTDFTFSSSDGSLTVQVIGNELQMVEKGNYLPALAKAKIKVQALLELTQEYTKKLELIEREVGVGNWDQALALSSDLRGRIALISLIAESGKK